MCSAPKSGKNGFSVNGMLTRSTNWDISCFVLNLELALCCEVHVLISRVEEEELGCLAVLALSGKWLSNQQ